MKKKIRPERLYLSTIADDAPETAAAYGLGLELAEFCTASNMDADFERTDALARAKMKRAGRAMLHAPFNELCPSAIDPLVLDVAKKRYAQAYELARGYGMRRMVVHSGFVPLIYFPEYFTGRAVDFWREYLKKLPADFTLVMENVLEDAPDMLIDIVRGVGDPRFKLCLDIGHANITKKGLAIEDWTRAVLPYLGHSHLHNNFGWPRFAQRARRRGDGHRGAARAPSGRAARRNADAGGPREPPQRRMACPERTSAEMIYECHGHIIADGVSYKQSMERHKNGVDRAYVRQALKTVADHGVGFYRDGGDKYMVSAYAKQIAGEYGIDYRTPVYITHKKGYYGSMYGCSFDDTASFHALVRQAGELDADFIKLTMTGMLDFENDGAIMGPVFSPAELREAVKIAAGEGFAVMAHVNGADNIKKALEAGVSSIEHGFWPDSSVIDYFLQADAVWVPTCAAVYNLIGSGRYSDTVVRHIYDDQRSVLAEAYARGVLIACGSDCGAWNVPQGSGTLDELSILKEMGIDTQRGDSAVERRFKRG